MEKNKKIYISIIVILSVLLVGLGGYTIHNLYFRAESVVDNENVDVEIEFKAKNLELTDQLVTSLVYPKVNGYGDSGAAIPRYIYKDINLKTYSRDTMMISAVQGISKIDDKAESPKYNAASIKNNFMKIFGPDTEYKDGDLSESRCCEIYKYNQSDNTYSADCRCGGAGPDFDNYTRLYKAVQNEDSIETYFYVQPYIEWVEENKYYLYDRELKSEEFAVYSEEDPYKFINYTKIVSNLNEVDKMMDKGDVDTYMFTFKEQSNGKYYFYSGAWLTK